MMDFFGIYKIVFSDLNVNDEDEFNNVHGPKYVCIFTC